MFRKFLNNFTPKIERAKYVIVGEVVQPNATLQASIFHQNMGEIKPLKFMMEKKNIQINDTVDTSLNAETKKGKIFVPNTKDYYMGEG